MSPPYLTPLRISLVLVCFRLTSCLDETVFAPAGTIIGRTVHFEGTPVRAFLGIPFAEPPVGRLRFRKPVPARPFGRPFEALALAPGCPQYSAHPEPTFDTQPGLAEDCLFLNVWAPADAIRKSVMFFVHTGGLTHSSSRLDFVQGQVLAARGDVIVVTTNYRLGALGFFYAGTDEAPGNMGLLDIVEAFHWVRRNIESFGGDLDSITLFGHSSGAIVVGLLTVSPLTRGLFRRAVLQSGAPTTTAGADNTRALRTSADLAAAVGCSKGNTTLETDPDAVVECMRGVAPLELIVKLSQVTADSPYQRPYYPRFGDGVLPRNPRLAVMEGDFAPVDLLLGSVSGEGSPLVTAAFADVFGQFGHKDPRVNMTLGAQIVREGLGRFPDGEAAVRHYLGGVDPEDYHGIRERAFTAVGDFNRRCPVVYFAESFARRNANVYYYYITRHVSNTPWAPWMLAVHFDEVPLVFGYPLRYPRNYTSGELELSRRMIQYWTSFAKTGVPLPDFWPLYSKARPEYRHLDTWTLDRDKYGSGPNRDNCDFFRPYFGF